jgi:hypothetical protein
MTTNEFRINDRVGFRPFLDKDAPARECRVKEINRSGALRLQEDNGPRIPWWITPQTAIEWAHAEALSMRAR